MAKFCGKCGSKLNESGKCSICDEVNKKTREKIRHKRKSIFIAMFAFGVILAFATAFMVLDYNEVIEVGICQNIGLKPSGTFDIFSSTDYLFSSDDKQLLTFYCKPPRGYAPTLKGECSEEFVDDGQYSNKGDIKKRDGIYTVNVFVTESKSKTIEFYALAKKGLKFYESNHIKIEIKDNWTNEEQKNIDKVDTSIQELINSDSYKKKDYENKVKSVKQLLDQLSTNGTPSINKKSLFFDEKSGLYNFSYSNGDLSCVKINKAKKENGLIYGGTQSSNNKKQYSSNDNENSNALIMYDWYTDNDEVLSFYQKYQQDWNERGLSTHLNQNPTVSQYANQLSNKKLILLAAHGSRTYRSLFEFWIKYSMICTNEKCTKKLDEEYKTDISQKNILKAHTEDGYFYWILPSFFTSHYNENEFDNSIILMNNCNGMGSDGDIDVDLSSSLIGKDSAAVGFHNSVNIFKYIDRGHDIYYTMGYGTLFLDTMISSLFDGEEFSKAYKDAETLIGSNESKFTESYWNEPEKDKESVFPVITGYGNATIEGIKQKSINEFKVAKGILKIGNKYIATNKSEILYKNNITEHGKMLAQKANTGQIMSDGKTIYFTVDNGRDDTNGHNQYDVYRTDIYENNVEKVFSGNYEVELVACKDGSIYYIDDETPGNGTVTFLTKLMKYDIKSDSSICVSEDNCATIAKYVNGKIYYSPPLISADDIDENTVFAYDIKSEKNIEVAKQSIVNPDTRKDRLCFETYVWGSNDEIVNHYAYYFNDNNLLSKSQRLPDGYYITNLGKTDTSFLYKSKTENTTEELYTFNLKTGEIKQIAKSVDRNNWIQFDEKKNEFFFIKFDWDSGNDSNSEKIYISRIKGNNIVKCLIDEKDYIDYQMNYSYWIEDGFFVDDDLECHILN